MPKNSNNDRINEALEHFAELAPSDFDAAQKIVETLTPAESKEFMNMLEKEMIDIVRENAEEYASAPTMFKNFENLCDIFGEAILDQSALQEKAELLNGLQLICGILGYIIDSKGEEANPVIKETVKVLSELSNADYNTFSGLMQAFAKGYEAGTGTPPSGIKPNPFRKPQGPRQ